MNIIRNIASSLITFFLVPFILIYLFFSSIIGVLSDQAKFNSILKENNTYTKLAGEIIPELIVTAVTRESSAETLPSAAVSKLVNRIDKTIIAQDLENIFLETHKYVTTDAKSFKAEIQFKEYFASISDNLEPALIEYYDSLPVCSAQETAKINQEFTANLTCRPTNMTTQQIMSKLDLKKTISDAENELPSIVTYTENGLSTIPESELFGDSQIGTQAQNPTKELKEFFTSAKESISALQTGIILLLLLLVASRLRSISSASKWVSSALFSGSFFPLISAFLLINVLKPDFFKGFLSEMIGIDPDIAMQQAAVSLAASNLADLSQAIFSSVLTRSLVVMVVSLILFGLYLFLNYKAKKKS